MKLFRARRNTLWVMVVAGSISICLQFLFLRHLKWIPEEPYIIFKNVLEGKGFSYGYFNSTMHPTCFIPPGYVGMLLAFWKIGLNDTGVQLSNSVVLVLAAIVIYRILRILGQTRGVSFSDLSLWHFILHSGLLCLLPHQMH